jgi:hypothetical protein
MIRRDLLFFKFLIACVLIRRFRSQSRHVSQINIYSIESVNADRNPVVSNCKFCLIAEHVCEQIFNVGTVPSEKVDNVKYNTFWTRRRI